MCGFKMASCAWGTCIGSSSTIATTEWWKVLTGRSSLLFYCKIYSQSSANLYQSQENQTLFTFFSVPFYFLLESQEVFLSWTYSRRVCTCPINVCSCCVYLYGCFSGHVFDSTRNIETNSACEHRSCIVVCVMHYAVPEELFWIVSRSMVVTS